LPGITLTMISCFRASDDFPSFAKSFSDVLLLRLIDVATEACYGDDKMKYNGVRALGNLLKYLQPHTLGLVMKFLTF